MWGGATGCPWPPPLSIAWPAGNSCRFTATTSERGTEAGAAASHADRREKRPPLGRPRGPLSDRARGRPRLSPHCLELALSPDCPDTSTSHGICSRSTSPARLAHVLRRDPGRLTRWRLSSLPPADSGSLSERVTRSSATMAIFLTRSLESKQATLLKGEFQFRRCSDAASIAASRAGGVSWPQKGLYGRRTVACLTHK